MTILITGAGGFIGSHVTELLLREGYRVRALVHYNSRADRAHISQIAPCLHERLDVCFGDVTDPFQMFEIVSGCEVVFHLAALIGIPYSYVAPASYVATNITGTLNILEACRRTRVRRVIITSTSEVYGTALYTPIDEQHTLQAQSPYSASKIAADKLAESYFRTFDLPVVILRPFNTYGPRQSARAVIPTLLVQVLNGMERIELGNLHAKRDLTFVEDTASAFVLAANAKGIEGQTIHFGQGYAVSIAELAELCLRVVGKTASVVSVSPRVRPDNSEVELLLCDPKKAKSMLGWKPSVSLEQGLGRTADYLRRHLSAYNPLEYVV
jgi:NAD dependent epimerase/dehydratase